MKTLFRVCVALLAFGLPNAPLATAHPDRTIASVHVTDEGYRFAIDQVKVSAVVRQFRGRVTREQVTAEIQRAALEKLEAVFPDPISLEPELLKITVSCEFNYPPLTGKCTLTIEL